MDLLPRDSSYLSKQVQLSYWHVTGFYLLYPDLQLSYPNPLAAILQPYGNPEHICQHIPYNSNEAVLEPHHQE